MATACPQNQLHPWNTEYRESFTYFTWDEEEQKCPPVTLTETATQTLESQTHTQPKALRLVPAQTELFWGYDAEGRGPYYCYLNHEQISQVTNQQPQLQPQPQPQLQPQLQLQPQPQPQPQLQLQPHLQPQLQLQPHLQPQLQPQPAKSTTKYNQGHKDIKPITETASPEKSPFAHYGIGNKSKSKYTYNVKASTQVPTLQNLISIDRYSLLCAESLIQVVRQA